MKRHKARVWRISIEQYISIDSLFEAGQWHSLDVLEEGTVVYEAKDGKYKPLLGDDIMK